LSSFAPAETPLLKGVPFSPSTRFLLWVLQYRP
jgi:hypothetical protein